jgi:hypothetical protein
VHECRLVEPLEEMEDDEISDGTAHQLRQRACGTSLLL